MKKCCANCEYWAKKYQKCEHPEQFASEADDYMAPPEKYCELWEPAAEEATAPDLTPLEAAKNLEYIDKAVLIKGIGRQYDNLRASVTVAASYLRKIASGEYAPVVHGHWKEVEPGHDILFECSNCGRIISTSWGCCEDEDTRGNNGCDPTDEWLCCPTCGALMGGKDDSHE